jgi:hypothetical protein
MIIANGLLRRYTASNLSAKKDMVGVVAARLIVDEVAIVDKDVEKAGEYLNLIKLSYRNQQTILSILSNHISICLGINVVNLN